VLVGGPDRTTTTESTTTGTSIADISSEIQTSTGWFPVIEPVVTPVQSLFIVPELLMVPDMLLMVPELSMVPELRMPVPPVFDTVMVPELVKLTESLRVPLSPEF